jgi:TPR repeat protein
MVRWALLAFIFSSSALGQAYKPTPSDRCYSLAAVRIGPEFSNSAPMPHELVEQLAEARAMCEQAVKDQPGAAALHARLARVLALAGDRAAALESARRGAELGSPNAQTLLGVLLARSDPAKAQELFRTAAKRGDPHAHFNLGVMEKDPAEAAIHYRRAADSRPFGDPLAMQMLKEESWLKRAAEVFVFEPASNPLRLPATLDTAALLAWYESRARAGEPWAMAYLGGLHENGQWVRQDYAAAAAWYRRAGEARHMQAQFRMARFYRLGLGVAKNEAESRRWGNLHQVQRCEDHEVAEASATACDRFASDRYDPDRVSAGVDSFCMRHFAERAVSACTTARKHSPGTVRFRSQLARAYAHTGRFAEARSEALAAAKAGSGAAMVLLGVMSQRGLGAPLNEEEARAWYGKAADAGNPRGAALSRRPMGFGAVAAPTPAERAGRGDASAQFNHAAGLEREKKYDEAVQWYTKAAAQGFRPAELNLAQMYEKGIGVTQDTGEARKRYRKLADIGDSEARYRAAKLAADAGDTPEALRYYERGVREDDWRSILDLAALYERGRGVPRDLKRAIGLYEKAAGGSPWTRFKLGILFYEEKNYSQARQWLERSAADDRADARNNLGWMHEKGLGAKADPAAARDLYLAALRGGSPHAKGNLENFFAAGRPDEASLRLGADAGIASAQYRLGLLKENVDLLLKAARQGHPQARKEAPERLYRLQRYEEAAELGHDGAMRKLAEQMAQKAGKPEAASQLYLFIKSRYREPPAPQWPSGFVIDPGEDQSRTMVVRVGGVAQAFAASADAAIGNLYDIIRWFPETDGKK